MLFDSKLLESLLHQQEGASLDFKSDQYQFENAPIDKKEDLLKDILAFANSWRQTTAYILIGVVEVKGGRSKVVGVKNHLEDASLHQFVNAKTQRPVEFSYLVFRIEGVEIGVIEIPLQERPVYLKKRFGGMPENTVFVRHGSSNDDATPDEIANMGAEQVLGGTPQFVLEWADLDKHTVLPSPYTLRSLVLNPPLPKQTFAPNATNQSGIGLYSIAKRPNQNFSEKIINYTFFRLIHIPLGLCLHNNSGVVGKRISFTGSLAKTEAPFVRERMDDPPSQTVDHPSLRALRDIQPFRGSNEPEVYLKEYDDRWEITADFGDIRPHEYVQTSSPLWFGSLNSQVARLEGKLLGDNLPEPIPCSLEISFQVDTRPMVVEDVLPYLNE